MRAVRSLIVLTFALLAQLAAACPMCRDSIAAAKDTIAGPGAGLNASGGTSVASGFNLSIYMMLAAFLFALGIVAFNLGRGIRK
jgi:hypothetical protein